MGGSTYSSSDRMTRSRKMGFHTKSKEQIFKQTQINNAMNPHGIVLREARDSEESPRSLGVIIGLDVTGSMGNVPHHLVKEGLPHLMETLIQAGVENPHILFLGIGDHECDSAPLQVGQFEQNDELLDKWLTDVYLEGGGGPNYGESYLLAWYFGAYHTALDCLEKRNQKGFIFTIGDEPTLDSLPKDAVKEIMGNAQTGYTAEELFAKAREMYNVYHVHISETGSGSRPDRVAGWEKLIGSKNVLVAARHTDVPKIIAEAILGGAEDMSQQGNSSASTVEEESEDKKEEIIL